MPATSPTEKRRKKLARLRKMLAMVEEDIGDEVSDVPPDDMDLAERAALRWAVNLAEAEIIRQTDATFLEKEMRHNYHAWFHFWRELRSRQPTDAANFVNTARRFVEAVEHERHRIVREKRAAKLAAKAAKEGTTT